MYSYKRLFQNQDICPYCGQLNEFELDDLDDMTEGQLADSMAGFRYCDNCGEEY